MNSRQLQNLDELFGPEIIEKATARYTRDYGIFSIEPGAIVRPRSLTSLSRLLRWAAREHVPVVARAGGSNTGGAAITDGILALMTDKNFGALTVDHERRTAQVGCAVRHDRLQHAAREHRLWLPSDPSSGPLSFIGGNVNTRASGPHALRHGAINRFVQSVEGVLPDGTRFATSEPETIPARLVDQLAELAERIRNDRNSASILAERRNLKSASGYDLLALLDAKHPIDAIPRLICGSMGTLCLTTAVTLRFEPLPTHSETVLMPFPSAAAACSAVLELREQAAAVEILGGSTVDLAHAEFGLTRDQSNTTVLLAEYQAHDHNEVSEQVEKATVAATTCGAFAERIKPAGDAATATRWWQARKALLPRLQQSTRGEKRLPYSVVNDVGASPEHLGALVENSESILHGYDLPSVIYGHAGSGNLHLRPLFLRGDQETVRDVARDVYAMVTDMGGTVTAEHGMGRLRAPFLEAEWGERIYSYMRELKQIFDPEGILNPGAMFVDQEHDFDASGWIPSPILE